MDKCNVQQNRETESKHEDSSIAINEKNDNYEKDEGWKVFRGVSVAKAEGVQI